MEANRHRHSRFFGKELAKVIQGLPSKFSNSETAENYFKQTLQVFSSEGEEPGRGYAGEVLCSLLACFPKSNATLNELAACESIDYLTFLLLD